MKVYSIGREPGCDIVINDRTDVVSRRHATLTVVNSRKMTITDQSCNGTYVNGIRISPNVPVPVTRKDNISFAHIASLDWNQVPQSGPSAFHYALIAIVALLLVGGGVGGYYMANKDKEPEQPSVSDIKAAFQDSINRVKEKEDSLQKAKQDSLDKAKQKQKGSSKANRDNTKGKKAQPTKVTEKKKETPKTTPTKKEEKKQAPSRVGRPRTKSQSAGGDSIASHK